MKGSEDCIHAPCECARCQRDSEREDHELPRLEAKAAPMPSPNRYWKIGMFEIDYSKPVILIHGLAYSWNCEYFVLEWMEILMQAS